MERREAEGAVLVEGGGRCAARHPICGGQSSLSPSPLNQAQDGQLFTGLQEVRVQERAQCLAMGSMPAAITAVLQDEMVDVLRPGGERPHTFTGRGGGSPHPTSLGGGREPLHLSGKGEGWRPWPSCTS